MTILDLPPRGTGLIIGTARRGLARGRGVPLTEEERRRRHRILFGQTKVVDKIISFSKDLRKWWKAHPIFLEVNVKETIEWLKKRPKFFFTSSGEISIEESSFKSYTVSIGELSVTES